MRNLFKLGLATAALAGLHAPATGFAQSARELRHDQRELARDRFAYERAMDRGDYRGARAAAREYREDHREYREDWRDYRRAHADRFRGPAYIGPRGYAYRPVPVGYRFAPDYYAPRYWVNDPGYYRLPMLPRHERWVRYGRDVVRVDIGTGRTLQVFGSFFL